MERLLDSLGPVDTTPLPTSAVVDGHPCTGSRALAAVAGAEVGVWVMTPGVATDVEVDEVFVVIAGSATIAFHDGETVDVGPGSVVRLRAGDRTTWTVHSTLRKVYLA